MIKRLSKSSLYILFIALLSGIGFEKVKGYGETVTEFSKQIPDQFLENVANSSQNEIALVALAVASASLFYLPLMQLPFIPFLFGKKRESYWGTVLNSLTGKPIKSVKITLYKITNSKEKIFRKGLSDNNGKYGFDVKNGEYKLKITDSRYKFPARYVQDEEVKDYYEGDSFIISSEEVPEIDLYADPDLHDNKYYKVYYYGHWVGMPVLILGSVYSLIFISSNATFASVIILLLYALIWLLFLLNFLNNNFKSSIASVNDQMPISHARIEFRNSKGKIVFQTGSNELGKFKFNLPNGKYTINASRPGYNSIKADINLTSLERKLKIKLQESNKK